MGRKKTKEDEALKYLVETKINEKKYAELQDILSRAKDMDMSTLLRDILHNRRIRIYTHDESLDMVMEELASIRKEIKAIGVNINQMTRLFNTYPDLRKKEFYAKIAFERHISLNNKIERLLEIVNKFSTKWLSE